MALYVTTKSTTFTLICQGIWFWLALLPSLVAALVISLLMEKKLGGGSTLMEQKFLKFKMKQLYGISLPPAIRKMFSSIGEEEALVASIVLTYLYQRLKMRHSMWVCTPVQVSIQD